MRLSIAVITAASLLITLGVAQQSNASIKRLTDIPAQPLDKALQTLASERDFQIVFVYDELKSYRTAGAVGRLTSEEALQSLLQGTGLTFRYLDEKTVTIVPVSTGSGDAPSSVPSGDAASPPADHPDTARGGSLWDRFRVAQVDQGKTTGTGSVESQRKSDSGVALSEVVVTAQRRTERLLDVPISMVALGTDDLQNRKITSLNDVQFAVPGMAISSDGFGNKIELRGVANILNTAPLVGIYLDEADVTNSGGAQINPNTYDLERVEVLRGPQGTLYGEGSAGGTVRFITKSPVLDRFGMTASVASLFTQGGSPGERINTATNIPLIDNELGVRIVGTYAREGGWIDQPAAGLKDINGQDLTNVRIKTLWQPSPQFSASFLAQLYRNDRSTGTTDDGGTNFTQAFYLTASPKASESNDIYSLTVTYDFPIFKILNATTYLREKVDAKDTGQIITFIPPGTPPTTYHYFSPYQVSNDHAWVEELRLSSVGFGPWQWTVGGFYKHYRDFYDQPISYFDVPGPPGAALPPPYGVQLTDRLHKSWSIFGDINYKLWERLTLGFGVRSFHETQDAASVVDYGYGPTETDKTGTSHSVDPRGYVQYKLSRDVNIYASAAKGFRSGGFNSSPTHPQYDPEDVRTYELGTKVSLLEGQLRADTAIFYTDYKGFVVSGFVNPSDIFGGYFNAGDARLKGIEWDFVWRPASHWSLGINGDYLDTRFTKITVTSSTDIKVGDPLDSVPKYQITSFAERDFAWNDKQVSMRLDYTRRGRMTYRNRALGLYGESDVINLLGCYVNLYWSKSLSFNIFAQNLLNDRGVIVPTVGEPVRERPRIYGVGFDVSL